MRTICFFGCFLFAQATAEDIAKVYDVKYYEEATFKNLIIRNNLGNPEILNTKTNIQEACQWKCLDPKYKGYLSSICSSKCSCLEKKVTISEELDRRKKKIGVDFRWSLSNPIARGGPLCKASNVIAHKTEEYLRFERDLRTSMNIFPPEDENEFRDKAYTVLAQTNFNYDATLAILFPIEEYFLQRLAKYAKRKNIDISKLSDGEKQELYSQLYIDGGKGYIDKLQEDCLVQQLRNHSLEPNEDTIRFCETLSARFKEKGRQIEDVLFGYGKDEEKKEVPRKKHETLLEWARRTSQEEKGKGWSRHSTKEGQEYVGKKSRDPITGYVQISRKNNKGKRRKWVVEFLTESNGRKLAELERGVAGTSQNPRS